VTVKNLIVKSMLRLITLCVAAALAGCGGGGSSGPASPTATARYLKSDPYPLGDAQPSYFVVSCDSTAPVNSRPALDASGARYLYLPLSGFSAGPHVCSIAAADASNTLSASESIPFTL